MNIDFATVGGTAWTVAGSMIIACENSKSIRKQPAKLTGIWRRGDENRCNALSRIKKRCIRKRRTEGDSQSRR